MRRLQSHPLAPHHEPPLATAALGRIGFLLLIVVALGVAAQLLVGAPH